VGRNVQAYPYLDPRSAEACPAGTPCDPARPGGPAGAGNDLNNPALLTAADREAIRPGGLGAAGIRGTTAIDGVANAAADPGPFTRRNALLAAAMAAAVVLASVPLLRAWRRRRRIRRAGHAPRSLILATYDVFTDRAAELGYPRAPGQTLAEYRRGIATTGPVSVEDLDVLTRLATDAAYAARDPNPGDATAAARASDSIVRSMRRNAAWTQRVTGPYRRR
jgi:hypothetical protein